MATVWLIIAWIVRGPYGRAITAMRDEELAFTALGRNAMSMKIALFAIGCGIAGIAGGLYAFYFQYLSPEQFDVLQSAAILTMVVLGGMGTTWGPVVGAALLLAMPQAITFLDLPPASWRRCRASSSPAWCCVPVPAPRRTDRCTGREEPWPAPWPCTTTAAKAQ